MSIAKKYLTSEHQERNAKILELWNAGWSGPMIAKHLGLKSRNVVVGVIDRAKMRGHVHRRRDRGEEAKPTDEMPAEIPHAFPQRSIGLVYDSLLRTSNFHYAPVPGGRLTDMRYPERRKPVPRVEDEDMDVVGIELVELSRKQCKWPLWSDKDTHRKCCGRDTSDRKVYCADHEARAWRYGTL